MMNQKNIFALFIGIFIGMLAIIFIDKLLSDSANANIPFHLEKCVNSADKSYMNENRPEYEIYMGNSYVEKGYGYYYTIENGQTNKYLEELLNEIDVNLKVCAEPEYID